MLIKTTKVRIIRDEKTQIVTIVPAHEIPILKRVHGESNVYVVNTDTNPRNLDPEEETERLMDRYGEAVVVRTFGELTNEGVQRALSDNEVKPVKAKGKKVEAEAESE